MRLFLQHHLLLILCYCSTFIVLFVFYDWLDGLSISISYFVILSLVILGVYLVIRYYVDRPMYEKIAALHTLEDAIISAPKSVITQAYTKQAEAQVLAHHQKIVALTQSQKEQQMLIQSWVHQVKTPVAVIDMLLQMANGNVDEDKIQQEVQKIHYSLEQLLTYIRLTDFSQDLNVEEVSVKQLLKEIMNEHKNFFIAKSVFPKLTGEDHRIVTDKKWFKIAVIQVLTNAIKYSDEHTAIHIHITPETITIANQGIGINTADEKRIFNLFYTGQNGRNYGESTGLGLYITQQVLTHLGHAITLTNATKQMTTFTITYKGT